MPFKLLNFFFVLLSVFKRHKARNPNDDDFVHFTKNDNSAILSLLPKIKAKEQISPKTQTDHKHKQGSDQFILALLVELDESPLQHRHYPHHYYQVAQAQAHV